MILQRVALWCRVLWAGFFSFHFGSYQGYFCEIQLERYNSPLYIFLLQKQTVESWKEPTTAREFINTLSENVFFMLGRSIKHTSVGNPSALSVEEHRLVSSKNVFKTPHFFIAITLLYFPLSLGKKKPLFIWHNNFLGTINKWEKKKSDYSGVRNLGRKNIL